MAASCVIAAYNEERTIGCVIRAARAVGEVREVIVVSDGSTDDTAAVARAAGADIVITLPKNLGKGGAVLAGVRRAANPVILLLDADLEHLKPQELRALIEPVARGRCEMAVGVLAADLVQRVLPQLSGIRALRRDVLLARHDLACTRFGFERALTTLARRRRWTIARVPFTGVKHFKKEEKYGLVLGYQRKACMALDLVGLRRRRRRHGAARPRAPAYALTVLLLMTAYLAMGLFTATRASGSGIELFPDPAPGDRYLLIVAHADDELLAAGGLIQRALSSGADVWVVFATNGDGNRLAAAVGGRKLLPRPADFIAEGELRQLEAMRALGRIGVPMNHLLFLGYPDRGLKAIAVERPWSATPYVSPFTRVSSSPYQLSFRPHAPYTGADMAHDIETIIHDVRPTVVLTHHEADRHGDHQALNAVVRRVLRTRERTEPQSRIHLYTFLVHAWDFPRPFRYAPDEPLLPPKSLWRTHRWVRFNLSGEELSAKRDAIQDYRSQLESPFLRLLLMSFLRRNELFAVAEP
jgi:LmbE family N-acetylglucosaminyl deacetylase